MWLDASDPIFTQSFFIVACEPRFSLTGSKICMRFVIGRKWSDLEFKKKDFYLVLYIKMAEAFETVDVILTTEQAEHINERHVNPSQHTQTSKFFISFNLPATFGLLLRRTWEDQHDVELI